MKILTLFRIGICLMGFGFVGVIMTVGGKISIICLLIGACIVFGLTLDETEGPSSDKTEPGP